VLGYRLKGRMRKGGYAGTSIPDYAISLKDGPVAIVIEIGVSQSSDDLMKCADKWLLGKGVQLVILVDIKVNYHEVELSSDSFSSNLTYESERGTRSSLPYDLEITDLRNGDFESVGLKILRWYASQTPALQLVQPQTITMYLYRHDKEDKHQVSKDQEVEVFNLEHGFTDVEMHITSKDFGIPSNIISREINLPLNDLKSEFPSILAEHSKDISEDRAIKLRERENDSDYESSSQVENSSAKPTLGRTKPLTRSSGRPNNTTESPTEATTSSRKKRKRNSTRAEESGASFGSGQNPSFRSTSSLIFPYESEQDTPRSCPLK
jgi:hypothetical protein